MKTLWFIVDENGRIVRGPVHTARARQLWAILRVAFPTYRLVKDIDMPAEKA